MARKKSRFSILLWMIVTAVSGGGLGGYMNPSLPIIGPLTGKILAMKAPQAGLGEGLATTGQGAQEPPTTALTQTALTQTGLTQTGGGPPWGQVAAQLASPRRPTNSILVASFNIQVLGKSKMSKPAVVDVLAKVIRRFDIVAIQEIRSKEDDIVPSLVAAVNADGSRYSFVIGPRLGRTVSTEQYAFLFDTDRVEHDPSSVGTIQDHNDMLHREPMLTRFRALTESPNQAFTFWLVNTHTDPDEVPQEVAALADVFQVIQRSYPDEDDVILLGDLNASETQLGRLGQIPGIAWAVRGTMTNTRQNRSYDNIIFDGQRTGEFTGRWGVFDLEDYFGLTRDQALQVSDHLPVWAEFGVWETAGRPSLAERLPGNRR